MHFDVLSKSRGGISVPRPSVWRINDFRVVRISGRLYGRKELGEEWVHIFIVVAWWSLALYDHMALSETGISLS